MNNSGIDVSVIMPVYNSQDYLRTAVESVLKEETFNLELILVDDGSTDGSGAICDALASEDSRVTVMHLQNGGMCKARNIAIAKARGDYLTFCDNDDYVLMGFVTENLTLAKKYNADCVRFGRYVKRVAGDGTVLKVSEDRPIHKAVLYRENISDQYDLLFYGTGGVWAGLYRKAFLIENNIAFNEDFRSGLEDILFNDYVYEHARVIVLNPRSYYCWIRRESHSASMVLGENRMKSLSTVIRIEDQIMQRRDIPQRFQGFYCDRIMSFVKDCLTTGFYSSQAKYSEQVENYENLYEVLEPYKDGLMADKPSFQYRVMRDLLLNKKYRLLHCFIGMGVALRRRALGNIAKYPEKVLT